MTFAQVSAINLLLLLNFVNGLLRVVVVSSWQSGHFGHQRTLVKIPSLKMFIFSELLKRHMIKKISKFYLLSGSTERPIDQSNVRVAFLQLIETFWFFELTHFSF